MHTNPPTQLAARRSSLRFSRSGELVVERERAITIPPSYSSPLMAFCYFRVGYFAWVVKPSKLGFAGFYYAPGIKKPSKVGFTTGVMTSPGW